jgi:hypothetical protein
MGYVCCYFAKKTAVLNRLEQIQKAAPSFVRLAPEGEVVLFGTGHPKKIYDFGCPIID